MRTAIIFIFVIGLSRCDYKHTFDKQIDNLAVWKRSIYVAVGDQLYQMNRDLTVEETRDLSGPEPDRVKVLVVFGRNNTLVTCVTRNCGYCEVLDLNNISKLIYAENDTSMTPFNYNASSLCFLVELGSGAYLMTGVIETNENVGNCLTHLHNTITLRNTMHAQNGEIFSTIANHGNPQHELQASVNFVDGFQLGPEIYIFVNVQSDKEVQLLRMQSKGDKSDVLQSTRHKSLSCCDEKSRWKLVSSSYIGGDFPGYWAGVFTAGNTSDQRNTALAIYNITKNPQNDLKPEAVAFTHPSMTSVAALSFGSWVVLFVGTANGQLIKIALDGNLKPTCPRVLYQSDDDIPVFYKMLLDPEDKERIYLAIENQLRAVSVAHCDKYSNMRDCWSAQDPFCGWCVPMKRCMFNSKCPAATVRSVYRRMVSLQIQSVSSDMITVNVTTPLRLPNGSSVSCSFDDVASDICDKPASPCSCTFPVHKLPTGGFNIVVRITVAEEEITEHLVVKNCTNITAASSVAQCYACVTSGCTWSSSQTCSWPNGELHQVKAEDVCKDVAHPLNYSEPEVHSVIPSVVSFHGKNNVKMLGKNLDHVTKIRLQGTVECYSEELQVLAQTADSLRFNLPSLNKGVMTICALLPDGRCVGSKTVTYGPPPHPCRPETGEGLVVFGFGALGFLAVTIVLCVKWCRTPRFSCSL